MKGNTQEPLAHVGSLDMAALIIFPLLFLSI